MSLGPFQEALGAMFALINEMEMAIKINTLIIFGNSAHLMGWKLNSLKARLCPLKSEREKKMWAALRRNTPRTWKGGKSITLRGRVRQETFSRLL